jgi:hypothetical protein
MELSKNEKKIARAIIEKGLQQEFATGLQKFYHILSEWKTSKKDNKESYYSIFKAVKNFDKHIARRYDDMSGSDYIFVIASQLADKIISDADIQEFSEQTQQQIKLLSGNE